MKQIMKLLPFIILLLSIICSIWYYKANTTTVKVTAKLERIEYDSWDEIFTGYFAKDNYIIRRTLSYEYINGFKLGKTYYITLTHYPDSDFILCMFGILIINILVFIFWYFESNYKYWFNI